MTEATCSRPSYLRHGRRYLPWSLALLLSAAGTTLPRSAAADDGEARSRQVFKQATSLADNGAWNEACPLFQAAHDIHATGGTAMRTADCYEKTGKYDRALELYRWVVDHRETDPNPDRVLLAMGRVSALQKQLGITPVKPRDGQPAPAPAPGPAPAAPPAPLAPVAPPAQPPPEPPSRIPVYVSYGVGGLGLVIGAITGGLALAQASSIKSACKPSVPCPQQASADSAANTKAWVANVGFGVAVAGAAVGTVLLLINRSPAAQRAAASAVGPEGLTLRF